MVPSDSSAARVCFVVRTKSARSLSLSVSVFRSLLQLAKGQMLGGADGFLKLIFDTSTLKLLGVHAFGEGATEIVHIGQVRGKNVHLVV